MASVIEVLQPFFSEHAGVGGLEDGSLLHLSAALLQEAFEDDAHRLVPERFHLKVEVPRAEQQRVHWRQLDDGFVMETQRPAFAAEDHVRVSSLDNIKSTFGVIHKPHRGLHADADTHACRLLDALQQVFGGDEEVQQTLQRIAAIAFLNEPEQLTEDSGGRHFERREEGGEHALDGRVQRLWILEDKEKTEGSAA